MTLVLVITTLILIITFDPVSSTPESTWTQTAYDDFDAGIKENVFVTVDGIVRLAKKGGEEAHENTFYPTEDLYINPGSVWPAFHSLWVGSYNGEPHRAFIIFDLTTIPDDALISSATLKLYPYARGFEITTDNYQIHRVTTYWSENVSWVAQPSFLSTPTETFEKQNMPSGTWICNMLADIDSSALINNWVSWVMLAQGENKGINDGVGFASKEHPENPNPQLDIVYYTSKYFESSGSFVSTIHDVGSSFVNWGTVNWSETVPENTALKFQIAANNDQSTWNFVGPDGASDTYYSSGQEIWNGHDNQCYMRYKVYLSSIDNLNTSILHEIAITYNNYPTVVPVSPADKDNIDIGTPSLSWEGTDADADSLTYRLQVDNDIDFSSPLIDEDGLGSSYTTPELLESTYYWRVRASDGALESPWSATRSFTIIAPSVVPWLEIILAILLASLVVAVFLIRRRSQ